MASSHWWYNVAMSWLYAESRGASIVMFFIDAPFGRFAPLKDSIYMIDGIKAWICMELVLPAMFITTFIRAPLSPVNSAISWTHPSMLLAGLFIIHYLNRAIISPLRTPSRSRSHILATISGIAFNIANGFGMGAYLSSPAARSFLSDAFARPLFFFGIALWALGFVGNVLHDETLLEIRRKRAAKKRDKGPKGEYYGIPHGMLYSWISYPNYFCEWIEWLGFALAAAPPPNATGFSLDALVGLWVPKSLTAPWLFVICEVLVMLPRAYRGHKWYLNKFPEYPKNRKAVVPFVL